MSLFHNENPDEVRKVTIVCSSGIRRGYEQTSAFFVHPIFNNTNSWPKTTTIPCYHDHHTFENTPFTLPLSYNNQSNTYTVFGIFCSPECVKGYMMVHPVPNNSLSLMWLKKMLVNVFDIHDDIVEAPPFYILKKYGGDLTIEQFRAAGKRKKRIIAHTLPFMACALAFELVDEHGTKKTLHEEKKEVRKIRRMKMKKSKTPQIKNETETLQNMEGPLQNMEEKSISPHTPPFSPLTSSIPSPPVKYSNSDILPPDLNLVSANAANRWEIRNLTRPSKVIDILPPQKFQHGKNNVYDKFLQQRIDNPPPPPRKPQVSKRRGRPKGNDHPSNTDTTNATPHSNSGTLEAFLR